MTIRQLTCFGMLLAANLLAMGERSLLADERDEFFEARIRPVLVEQCYQCHNSAKTAEGGWRLIRARRLSKGATGVRSSFRENRRKADCWRFCGMRSMG